MAPLTRLDLLWRWLGLSFSSHRPRPLLDASIVLLQMLVQGAVGTMTHLFLQRRFNRIGIGVVPIGRHAPGTLLVTVVPESGYA